MYRSLYPIVKAIVLIGILSGCKGSKDNESSSPSTVPAPSAPASVDDARYYNSLSESPTITWEAVAAADYYEYAIGSTSGGNDILDWVRANATSAQATGVDLEEGTTYFASVRAVNESGASSAASADGWLVDVTAPSDVTSVDLGGDGTLEQTPTLTWQASTEVGSGLTGYQLAIGTTVGGEEFQEWTSLGEVVTYQVADTELEEGTTYYASIRAVDAAGNISDVVTSLGWVAAAPDPCADQEIGEMCTDGTIYIGTYNGAKYTTTRGGCGPDPTNPECDGSTDTTARTWGPTGGDTLADSHTDGASNTEHLATIDPDVGAAGYCHNLVFADYEDWFLPALDELMLFRTAYTDGITIEGLAVGSRTYWSSTETTSDFSMAWKHFIFHDAPVGAAKSQISSMAVRCVRKY